MRPRRATDKRITRAQARAALTILLTMRRSLDGLSLDSLVRSYNLPPNEIAAMVEAEKRRRAAR